MSSNIINKQNKQENTTNNQIKKKKRRINNFSLYCESKAGEIRQSYLNKRQKNLSQTIKNIYFDQSTNKSPLKFVNSKHYKSNISIQDQLSTEVYTDNTNNLLRESFSLNQNSNKAKDVNTIQNQSNQIPIQVPQIEIIKNNQNNKINKDYITKTEADDEIYNGQYYPPPEWLRHELKEQISNIIFAQHDKKYLDQIQKIQTETKKKYFSILEKPFNKNNKNNQRTQNLGQKQKVPYINIKRFDIDSSQKHHSKISKTFIDTYINFLKNEDNDKIEHDELLEIVIPLQINPTAQSSYKPLKTFVWKRLIQQKSMCPQLKNYPLSPKTLQEIQELQQLKQRMYRQLYSDPKNKIMNEMMGQLITDNKSPLDEYLKRIVNLKKDKFKIYDINMQDLTEMQKYAKIKQQKMQGNSYQIRTEKAYEEVKYVKDKMGNWLQDQENKQQYLKSNEFLTKLNNKDEIDKQRERKRAPDFIKNKHKKHVNNQQIYNSDVSLEENSVSVKQNPQEKLNIKKSQSIESNSFDFKIANQNIFQVKHCRVPNEKVIFKRIYKKSQSPDNKQQEYKNKIILKQ